MTDLPFETGDTLVRYRVLTGENDDPDRRGDKQLVARSQCALTCPDTASIERTIEALRSSDEQLKLRPDAEKFYDWTSTYIEMDPAVPDGGRVLFGVAWYDEPYFTEKATAFQNSMHRHMFSKLGVALDAIEVTHWREVQLAA
ncbi:hypothetical protein OG453_23640 [Streptomyces sp. NBC_01381]|uniref:hypothetical protein n=1 Tax=Streptomyces sp. NBC_01381 TaxID=2903845 RepID=UPI00225731D8|nr:hypothetical protein [Streptomyces sp. NBC_01381]MCX4669640.1 hypothetical protein [Streptomyces sp. NBC_01381]